MTCLWCSNEALPEDDKVRVPMCGACREAVTGAIKTLRAERDNNEFVSMAQQRRAERQGRVKSQ